MTRIRTRTRGFVTILFFISSLLFLNTHLAFSVKPAEQPKGLFVRLDAEIMEVEELNEPRGSAIYTVKDLSSGKTLRLFVDPYRSLIQIGGKPKSAGDALGGSKATIIYQKLLDKDMPEVIFAQVTSSYYS